MADIDLTNVTPILGAFSQGLPLATDDTPLERERFNNCWAVIVDATQGLLDADNFNATLIPHDATRRGSLVKAQSVGGTANLDYLALTFSHVDQGSWLNGSPTSRFDSYIADNDPISHAIPGGSTVLTLDHPAVVDILWNVFWVNDSFVGESLRRQSFVCLKINDDYIEEQIRGCGSCGEYTVGSEQHNNAFENVELSGYSCNRTFTGHHQVELTAGEHTIALHHISDRSIPCSRVWTRGLRVVTFPYLVLP